VVRFLFAAILLWGILEAPHTACAVQRQGDLLQVGQPAVAARLVAIGVDGVLEFRIADQLRRVDQSKLVRWSTPLLKTEARQLILVDGSRLVLADAWSGEPSLQLDAKTVTGTTKLLGKIRLPQTSLRAILLSAPAEPTEQTRFVDAMLDEEETDDQLLLVGGDVFRGKLIGISKHSDLEDRPASVVRFKTELGPIEMADSHVAAIACAAQKEKPPVAALWEIGLRDGSRLRVRSLVADAKQLRIELTDGTALVGSDVRDIVSLQSLGTEVCYLSDLDASDYRHVAYLKIPWPYRRDRNVLGGPLKVDGRVYGKGLAMHSASRLAYRLDDSSLANYRHFCAEIALDDAASKDAASKDGSVVFHVYLLQDKTWQCVFTSPVVRGGERPLAVSVELGQATGLALAIDYADRGDERDYANWLDARLE